MKKVVVAFLVLVTGCVGHIITNNGIEVYASIWHQTTSALEPKFSIMTRCPRMQVKSTLLERHGRFPTVVAVEGCGHAAIYARTHPKRQWIQTEGTGMTRDGQPVIHQEVDVNIYQ